MRNVAEPIVRGCGVRVKGGLYLEAELGPDGIPPQQYLVCPPEPINPLDLGVTPIGVQIVDFGGVSHVLDWVGSQHYPNVADYLAELRNHGASRRISKSVDFSRLTPESRLLLIHSRAVIKNAAELWQTLGGVSTWVCPVHGPGGCSEGGQTCHALYREVVEGGAADQDDGGARSVIKKIGDTTYHANSTPEGFTPEWGAGIFARLPITRIAAIRDEESGAHDEAAAAARESSLPVTVEEQ